MRSRQQGTTTVEFAIIGAAALIVLFGVIEVSRALFVWNTITEATRRGARVAAVCPMYHDAVRRVTMFGEPNGGNQSPVLPGLSSDNVFLLYLDEHGDVTVNYLNTEYVQVSILNYQHTLLIPFVGRTVTVPSFTTTLPKESLGYIPELGTRQCFGF